MPGNIAQYNSPIDKLQPSETGAETLARMGRVEKENYDEAGRAYGGVLKEVGTDVSNYQQQEANHQYQQEVSQGSAGLAVMNNNLATNWNKTLQATDPNDSTVQQKFMDNANQQISDWQGQFSTEKGQAYASQAADQMRNHLWEHTSADMNIRAGTAAVDNLKTTTLGWRDTVTNDPSAIPHALDQVDLALQHGKDAAAGIIGEAQAAKLDKVGSDVKNEIVKAGMKGAADGNNPQGVIDALNAGAFKDHLTPEEVTQLKNYATVQIHAKDVDKQNQQVAQQQQKQQAAYKASSDIFTALSSGKGVAASAAVSNPAIPPDEKRLLIAKNGILSMDPAKLQTSAFGDKFATTVQSIYSNQPLTSKGLYTGIVRGEISPAGALQLQKLQEMQKTPEGMAELSAQKTALDNVQKQMLKGGPMSPDPVGQQQYNSYLNSFYPSWDAAIRKGATPAELSDPNNKAFIGPSATQSRPTGTNVLEAAQSTAAPATHPSAPPMGSPERAAWVKKMIFSNGQ